MYTVQCTGRTYLKYIILEDILSKRNLTKYVIRLNVVHHFYQCHLKKTVKKPCHLKKTVKTVSLEESEQCHFYTSLITNPVRRILTSEMIDYTKSQLSILLHLVKNQTFLYNLISLLQITIKLLRYRNKISPQHLTLSQVKIYL